MRALNRNVVFSTLLMMIMSGCSVKEDRSLCPCTVLIDFSGLDISVIRSVDVRASSPGGLEFEDVVPAELFGEEYAVLVPRSGTFLNLSFGDDGSFSPGKGFTVMPGEEFPALYLHQETIDTGLEHIRVPADLHKSFCNITVLMKPTGPYPYSITVEGNVCGYNPDGTLGYGDFSFTPEIDGTGKCSVRVPRQDDASLMLCIREDDDTLREFALGEYIIESGYDWSSPDLEDIEIEIDYAETEVSLTVNGWETVISFEVII